MPWSIDYYPIIEGHGLSAFLLTLDCSTAPYFAWHGAVYADLVPSTSGQVNFVLRAILIIYAVMDTGPDNVRSGSINLIQLKGFDTPDFRNYDKITGARFTTLVTLW